jgi:hypothetical protein
MSRAQIVAGILRYPNEDFATLLLVFFLIDHKRFEDDGEENWAEKEAEKSEIGEAPERR